MLTDVPIITLSVPPSTNSILALPLDSTRKSLSALDSLNTKDPPSRDISPVAVMLVAVRACAAIVLPDSAVNVLAVITKSFAPAT